MSAWATRAKDVLTGRSGWLLAVGLTLLLLLIARYPTQPWGFKTDGPLKISPAINQTEWLAQEFRPIRADWSYLLLSFGTFQRSVEGAPEVLILSGADAPRSEAELTDRVIRRVGLDASKIEDKAGLRVEFEPIRYCRGRSFLVVIRRVGTPRISPLIAWTTESGRPGAGSMARLLRSDQGRLNRQPINDGFLLGFGGGLERTSLLPTLALGRVPWSIRLVVWAGLAVLVGAVRLALAWLHLGLAGLARFWEDRGDGETAWRRATVVWLALVGIALLATVHQAGINSDEYVHIEYGDRVLEFFLSGFKDLGALSYKNLYYYGGLLDGVSALLSLFSPIGPYETKHCLVALIGWLGLVGAWKLADALAGRRAAFWAALLLGLLPAYLGDCFNNNKDIPFAAGYVWALYYLVLTVRAFPTPPWRLVAKLALTVGLCLSARVGGVLLWAYAGLAGAVYLGRTWRGDGLASAAASAGKLIGRVGAPLALGSTAIMLAGWPYALVAPLANPVRAMIAFGKFPVPIKVLFNGRNYLSLDLPWTYLPVYLAIKLPEIVLILLVLGLVYWLGPGRRRLAAGPALIGLAALFPPAYAVVSGAALYDGIRHFLFILPPLAALAALSLERWTAWLGQRFRPAGWLTGLVVVAALSWPAYQVVALHPYQFIYYNSLVGGVRGAQDRFVLDYQQNTYLEAMGVLVDYLEAQGLRSWAWRFKGCDLPWEIAAYIAPPRLDPGYSSEKADFVLAYRRKGYCGEEPGCREIGRVERMGVVLNRVYDCRTDPGKK